jgi:outer membrane lipoprotein-sorting protein
MELLLAAVLLLHNPTRDCLQDKSAEETFKDIEENIAKAKTVSLTFKAEVVLKKRGVESIQTMEGTAHFKEGNKANLFAVSKAQGREEDYSAISDGSRLRRRAGKADAETMNAPEGFVERFEMAFARAGMSLAFFMTQRPSTADGEKGQDVKKAIDISDFKHGEDNSSLSYKLRFPETEPDLVASCVLRYDPKTLRLLGRKTTIKRNGVDAGVFTDTYDEFILNADIPDEKFKLPAEK